MTTNDQQQALSVKEYARRVGIGRTRLYVEIRLGRVKVLKSGRRTIIPVAEVEAFFLRLEAAQAKKAGGR
jgi:excisionase family DNA binding protein